MQNSLNGSTGILYVPQATSGLPGTFRLSLNTGFYSGTGFLCSTGSPCPAYEDEESNEEDDLRHVSAHLGLSATLLPNSLAK